MRFYRVRYVRPRRVVVHAVVVIVYVVRPARRIPPQTWTPGPYRPWTAEVVG